MEDPTGKSSWILEVNVAVIAPPEVHAVNSEGSSSLISTMLTVIVTLAKLPAVSVNLETVQLILKQLVRWILTG